MEVADQFACAHVHFNEETTASFRKLVVVSKAVALQLLQGWGLLREHCTCSNGNEITLSLALQTLLE